MTQPEFERSVPQRVGLLRLMCAMSLCTAGCLTEVRVIEQMSAADGGGAPGSDGSGDSGGPTGADGGTAESDDPRCPVTLQADGSCVIPIQPGVEFVCTHGGVCREVAITNVDKVDLLFVIDNSESMAEEQKALRYEFPKLLTVLSTGDREQDGVQDMPPAKDLHLGVVSSDMGAVGVDGLPACEGYGDDGLLNQTPGRNIGGCQGSYPRFLSYQQGLNSPDQSAVDLACLADLGTGGCEFEQPLEAALKALWPSSLLDPGTGLDQIWFLGDGSDERTLGHGDRENAGFVRADPADGPSILAVVVISDEDDCSSSDTRHFTPASALSETDPLAAQPMQLRCFHNKENLYTPTRYLAGLRAMRPGQEHLTLFMAIAGVPADRVDAAARARHASDPDGFYEDILDDPRMQEVVDPPSGEDAQLTPVCETATRRALPARRLVEVAREFGESALVQSICEDDFGPAIDALAEQIGERTGAPCLDVPLARRSDGKVDCDLFWELPPPGEAPATTPTACGQRDFDFLVDAPDRTLHRGSAVCAVQQIAVVGQDDDTRHLASAGEGFYYDDFSEQTEQQCAPDRPRRIAFTPAAMPPAGVRVFLDCRP